MRARGEAEFGLPSPAAEMITKLGAAHARSANPQTAEKEQRLKRLRPYVKKMASAYPDEKPAGIATLLRQKVKFKKVPRSTLEGDVKALMAE
jgi:hypothetical protein